MTNDRITKKYLAFCAEEVQRVLEQLRITNLQELDALGKMNLDTSEGRNSYVLLHRTPSNLGTLANKISYIAPADLGVPLEICLNGPLNYTQFILKVESLLENGYFPFGRSITEIGQFKRIRGVKFESVFEELKMLQGLGR